MTFPPLPSLDRARAEIEWEEDIKNVIAENPEKAFVGAAIVLQIDAIRREQWDDEVEMSERLFQSFPRGMIPAPKVSVETSWKIIPDDAVAKRAPCTECAVTRGRVFCQMCGGTGHLATNDQLAACLACNGTGTIACSACDGTAVALTTKIRYVNDRAIALRRAFVPRLGTFTSRIEALVDPSAAWEAGYAFEPQPQVVASAYRGAAAVREPDFHGFFFGDALNRTLEAIAELSNDPTIAAHTERCFAAPILWLVYPHLNIVLVTQPNGSLVQFTNSS